MVESALVCHGQQRVLVTSVELLRIASEGFGSWAKREVSQAAFFKFGKFAADIVCRTGDNTGHTVLATKRDSDLNAGQSFLADERTKGFGQLDDALLCVKRIGFFAPANRSRDDTIAGIFVIRGACDECKVQHRAAHLDDCVPSLR